MIVQGFRKKDGSTCDKPATVRRESVRPRALPEPKSRSEACIQQHPDIEQTLEKLARQLARCEINPLSAAIQKIFVAKLQEATARQILLGHKAIWKRAPRASIQSQLRVAHPAKLPAAMQTSPARHGSPMMRFWLSATQMRGVTSTRSKARFIASRFLIYLSRP